MFIVPFVRGVFCHLFNKRILDWILERCELQSKLNLSPSVWHIQCVIKNMTAMISVK